MEFRSQELQELQEYDEQVFIRDSRTPASQPQDNLRPDSRLAYSCNSCNS